MHNSKMKKIISVLLVLAVSAGVFWALDFALYPCTFMRNDIHSVCTKEVDDIYVGTSHGKMNIDPASMEEVSGRTGHNLCVGGEYSIDTYYMTKLLLEKGKKPSRIVYEVSPGYFTLQKEEGNNYLLFYHEFPMTMAKLEYFMDAIAPCNFRTSLFPWYEYPLSYELANLSDTISKKAAKDFGTEDLETESQKYHENGFIERYPTDPATFTMKGLTEFHVEDVKEENVEYLKKLINLCKENGIEFVAVTTPVPMPTLKKFSKGYNEAWDYFEDIFEEQNVPYINFNTKEYFKTVTHRVEDFTDLDGHMHGDAARMFSKTLARVLDDVTQ